MKTEILRLKLNAKKLENFIELLNEKFSNDSYLLKTKKNNEYFRCKILSFEEIEKKLDVINDKNLEKEIFQQKKQGIFKNELSVVFVKNKNKWSFYSFDVVKEIFEKKLFDNNLNIVKPNKSVIKIFNKYIMEIDKIFYDNIENTDFVKIYYLTKNKLFDKLKFYKYRKFFPNKLHDEKFEYGIKTFEYPSLEFFLKNLTNLNHEKITSITNEYERKKVKEINTNIIDNNISIFNLL